MLLAQRSRQEGPLSRRFSSRALRSLLPFLSFAALSAPVSAQVQGADPAGSGPIVAALGWLQGTLLGNVATAVAVMAVAAVGFMMLTGRMNWRFGATVIIGCFILFGAGAIVSGIQTAAG
ncbi:TrbC/VirB2 family protein [Novosphingobium sp. JCM 18896]|nr:TrbC/VirB2 family protein [Novosphingobium sp. JCM 18896]